MGKFITPDNWKMRIIRTDRNEIRVHTSTSLVSIFYKNAAGLKVAYEFAKKNLTKDVALAIKDKYRKLRMQGA